MRIHEAIHKVVEKFSPMTDKSSEELSTSAGKEYYALTSVNDKYDQITEQNAGIQKLIDDPKTPEKEREELEKQLQELPKINLLHKIARVGEKWWFRYLVSMFFIVVVKKIQDAQNAIPADDDED